MYAQLRTPLRMFASVNRHTKNVGGALCSRIYTTERKLIIHYMLVIFCVYIIPINAILCDRMSTTKPNAPLTSDATRMASFSNECDCIKAPRDHRLFSVCYQLCAAIVPTNSHGKYKRDLTHSSDNHGDEIVSIDKIGGRHINSNVASAPLADTITEDTEVNGTQFTSEFSEALLNLDRADKRINFNEYFIDNDGGYLASGNSGEPSTFTKTFDNNSNCTDENCSLANSTCIGEPMYCNYTYDEYLRMLHDYISPTVPEWILIASHIVVFCMGLVRLTFKSCMFTKCFEHRLIVERSFFIRIPNQYKFELT